MRGTRNRIREDWTSTTPADWMNTSLSDWMDITPSEWMDRMRTVWERSSGNLLRANPMTNPFDWWSTLYGLGGSQTGQSTQRTQPRHRRETECRRCESESCECACCIGDVDLVIDARVGEQRVIPIVIENDRHREKQIDLEISEWTTRGGRVAQVETRLLEPRSFVLPSCGEQNVTLVVNISGAKRQDTNQSNETGATAEAAAQQAPVDVDTCLVAIADVRLIGCDIRPLRIAVAILPRDCDPYRVDCGCACC